MKQFVLFVLLLFKVIFAFPYETKQISFDNEQLFYHIINADAKRQNKILVFLHGSVILYHDLVTPKKVPLDSLLEMNSDFEKEITDAGYACIVPIAKGEYNWLNPKGEIFLDEILKQEALKSTDVFLSGFSDGATGSYRYFYNNPQKYKGLLLFNAYPQLDYFSSKVDYKKVRNKKVIFVSQDSDKRIPYEFSLLEYRRQKLVNKETYFVLREGKHEFQKYTNEDFKLLIRLLERPMETISETDEFMRIFPAIDGLIIDNVLMEAYPFRKSIGKKFGMDIKEYMSQQDSYQFFKKKIENQEKIQFITLFVSNKEFESTPVFELKFTSINDGGQLETIAIFMDNYFLLELW